MKTINKPGKNVSMNITTTSEAMVKGTSSNGVIVLDKKIINFDVKEKSTSINVNSSTAEEVKQVKINLARSPTNSI